MHILSTCKDCGFKVLRLSFRYCAHYILNIIKLDPDFVRMQLGVLRCLVFSTAVKSEF